MIANLQELLKNPAAHFTAPAEVVEDTHLSRQMKEKILRKWENDAHALQIATDEGMAGADDNPLPEISEALIALQKEPASVLGD